MAVMSDRDVWAAAMLMVKRYGADAMTEAAQRADALLEEGAWHGALTWRRILDAIKQLQASKPAEDEPMH